MDALLQLIGKGSDQQIATEAQRRASAAKLKPSKPQLRCRSIKQARDFGFDLAQARLSCALHSGCPLDRQRATARQDRKSTRLNSSHMSISYAVFCLKKKTR